MLDPPRKCSASDLIHSSKAQAEEEEATEEKDPKDGFILASISCENCLRYRCQRPAIRKKMINPFYEKSMHLLICLKGLLQLP